MHSTKFPLASAGCRAPSRRWCCCCCARGARGAEIEVTSGVRDPVPVAIVPFAHGRGRGRRSMSPASSSTTSRAAGASRRCRRSACRRPRHARRTWRRRPGRRAAATTSWSGASPRWTAASFAVDFDLVNTLTGVDVWRRQRFTGSASSLRNAAHRVSDVVYQKILGVRGAFATRIAYVAVDGEPPAQTLPAASSPTPTGTTSSASSSHRYPIMSPAWSPDGQWLAYVSFESKHSAVYVQLVRTGERRQVSARAGINGAPGWSPDGKQPGADARREQSAISTSTCSI